MTANPANSTAHDNGKRLVVFVVYPNVVLLDLVGPLQVFTHAHDQKSKLQAYQTALVSKAGGSISTNTIVSVDTEPISRFEGNPIHTLVIVGGDGAYTAMHDAELVDAVRITAKSANRICSVCSGALILASAGLLAGRHAVTHWEDCQQLEEMFPNVIVERDPIFVKDGQIWTSAGVTAGIDLALAIVAEDLGRASSLELARSMVTPMVRTGGQSQFSSVLAKQLSDNSGRFEKLHTWIAENLMADLRVEELAKQVAMSPRNFARQYSLETNVTPAKAVESIRVEVARNLLESSDHSIQQVAILCGFKDYERLRKAFIRHVKTSPTVYRSNFQSSLSQE